MFEAGRQGLAEVRRTTPEVQKCAKCFCPLPWLRPGSRWRARRRPQRRLLQRATSATLFNHYSLLGTAEQLLCLPALGQAASYPTMTTAFNL